MSIRAELIRLGLRWLIKRRMDVKHLRSSTSRQSLEGFAEWVPNPPAGTETIERRCRRHTRRPHYAAGVASGLAYSLPPRRRLHRRLAGALSRFHLAHRQCDPRARAVHRLPARTRASVPGRARGCGDCLSLAHCRRRRSTARSRSWGIQPAAGSIFATLLKLRDEGVSCRRRRSALSPFTDLALTGASIRENAKADPFLPASESSGLQNTTWAARIPARPMPRHSMAIRPACRRPLFMSAAMRSCVMTAYAWRSACAPPDVRPRSRCGRACRIAGTCSGA